MLSLEWKKTSTDFKRCYFSTFSPFVELIEPIMLVSYVIYWKLTHMRYIILNNSIDFAFGYDFIFWLHLMVTEMTYLPLTLQCIQVRKNTYAFLTPQRKTHDKNAPFSNLIWHVILKRNSRLARFDPLWHVASALKTTEKRQGKEYREQK